MDYKVESRRNLAGEVERMTRDLALATKKLEIAYRAEKNVRQRLLRIHGVMVILAGWLMLVFGTAPALEIQIGIWMRGFVGYTGMIAGICLLYGQFRRNKHYTAELVGVLLVGLWDMLMVMGFAVTYTTGDYSWRYLNPFEMQPLHHSLPYPVIIYGGLTSMLWGVHLPAVWRDWKVGRR